MDAENILGQIVAAVVAAGVIGLLVNLYRGALQSRADASVVEGERLADPPLFPRAVVVFATYAAVLLLLLTVWAAAVLVLFVALREVTGISEASSVTMFAAALLIAGPSGYFAYRFSRGSRIFRFRLVVASVLMAGILAPAFSEPFLMLGDYALPYLIVEIVLIWMPIGVGFFPCWLNSRV